MDLGNEHIPKLVRQIAIPASVGMFFNTMYNVVDTFWAGQLSPEALAALSLSLIPFIGLLAVGIGLGQGASALISNALGAEDDDQASRLMAQALSLAFVVSAVVRCYWACSLPHFCIVEWEPVESILSFLWTT
jgi:Na+-driven multidrug efflux pump